MGDKCQFCGAVPLEQKEPFSVIRRYSCGSWVDTGATSLKQQHITCMRIQLAAQSELLREAVVIAQGVMDDREMPFRCNCDYTSPTIDTGHGVLCKVTLARAFLARSEIKALGR
jgi:hypothetical protein